MILHFAALPEPADKEFVRLVHRNLAKARRECDELLGIIRVIKFGTYRFKVSRRLQLKLLSDEEFVQYSEQESAPSRVFEERRDMVRELLSSDMAQDVRVPFRVKRRVEILQLLASGAEYTEIAMSQNCGYMTIKNDCIAMREILGARNLTHLVAQAIRRGIID